MKNMCRAEFKCANADDWRTDWNEALRFLPPPRVKDFENACLLPLEWLGTEEAIRHMPPWLPFRGGVCDSAGGFVAGHRRSFFNPNSCFSALSAHPGGKPVYRDEDVVFGGVLHGHWGHLLVDSTSRLWFPLLHKEDHRKIVFLEAPLRRGSDPTQWRTLFALAGLDPDRIEVVAEPTRFRNVTVPEQAIYSQDAVRKEWILFFDSIRKNIKPSPLRKVYLSRSGFSAHDMINEDLIERHFRKCGYSILRPEDCSIEEEISAVAGADELATTIGTLSHAFLFARPGARATVLLRTGTVIRPQLLVHAARGMDCTYVDMFRNILPTPHDNGVFFLYPSQGYRDQMVKLGLRPEETDPEPFAESRRISDYCRKWLSDLAPRMASSRLQSMSPVLETSLNQAENDNAKLLILEHFAETELGRLSDCDRHGVSPTQKMTMIQRIKMAAIPRLRNLYRAIRFVFRRKHDL